MFDQFVEFSEVIARNGCVHVVFDMVVHLPVKEADDRMNGEGAAAEAEVINIVLEASMLCVVTEEKEPLSDAAGRAAENGDDPLSGSKRRHQDQGMPGKRDARPADRRLAAFGV